MILEGGLKMQQLFLIKGSAVVDLALAFDPLPDLLTSVAQQPVLKLPVFLLERFILLHDGLHLKPQL